MGYHTDGLTFNVLRSANAARLPTFRNAKGELSHPEDGSGDWSLNDWMTAVTGELGEAANILKKVRRGDMSLDEARPALSKELADVQTYLDILAKEAGIDLGKATISKFNEISARVKSDIYITSDGSDWHYGLDYRMRNETDGMKKLEYFPYQYMHATDCQAFAHDLEDAWNTGKPCSCKAPHAPYVAGA